MERVAENSKKAGGVGIDECYQELASAIVIQAAKDWRELKARGVAGREKVIVAGSSMFMDEVESFFNGDWCQLLCGDIDPTTILLRLEKEYEAGTNEI